jgi:hypothetical protein
MSKLFAKEADLVAAFCGCIDPAKWERNAARAPRWTAYHETAGWDLLLVHQVHDVQIGIEAKLSLNPKVLEQALPGHWSGERGPDFRAVLVPEDGLQRHMCQIATHLGIVVITVRARRSWRANSAAGYEFSPELPDLQGRYRAGEWPDWCPTERCRLPEYVPDVSGGHASPIQLSIWKIKAIRLLVLLDRFGSVTRKDMAALEISPTRWTASFHGFLNHDPALGAYVRNSRTPDLKAQHPVNFAQIEADIEKWLPAHRGGKAVAA